MNDRVPGARNCAPGTLWPTHSPDDAGLTSLAEACASGALASFKTLAVDDGPLGTEHPALKAVCQACGIELR